MRKLVSRLRRYSLLPKRRSRARSSENSISRFDEYRLVCSDVKRRKRTELVAQSRTGSSKRKCRPVHQLLDGISDALDPFHSTSLAHSVLRCQQEPRQGVVKRCCPRSVYALLPLTGFSPSTIRQLQRRGRSR
ncbi:cysteine-tRNA ligase [Pseudozyma hubeiensis SY62]|uniref:Cysteine-tRNA ligase n=1 Tax=Pseudozyma hubeiensis (strain SY62) TaxID=1305764 RepID=R9PGE5_PSEHS|nr:cysteine-tRNA ligase [Pseudozyma hubeiensis SY62]GAC97180.1 cysteine-tRNA ligase [Pseudozyma hubeiensis SY62]